MSLELEETLKLYQQSLLIRGSSNRTIYIYYRCLKKILMEINKPIEAVTSIDIKHWLAIKQNEISLRTCENYRSYLYSFFGWLTREDMIDKNPMLKVNVIKFEKKLKKTFSKVEIEKLSKSCSKTRDRAIFEILLATGIRVSELCNTNISDVDFEDRTITIHKTKSKVERIVFLNDTAKYYLEKYLSKRNDDLSPVFISNKKCRWNPSSIERRLKKLGEIAKVTNVRPHRFRHTFATTMHQKGMSIRSIQQLLGHADINMTVKYVASDKTLLKNEFDRCC